jgi:hypothetical protein
MDIVSDPDGKRTSVSVFEPRRNLEILVVGMSFAYRPRDRTSLSCIFLQFVSCRDKHFKDVFF